ncbi:MAG TPA: hypothetical protein VGC13_30505 [Longimicrobium sp.]|jgi:hypothetical protein|uniref:hypothetical protein n=1 Tax=Longimicrobium sp. TaxID=2029185 RepID=UPI002EDAB5C6
MKKLLLAVEDLAVESFDTAVPGDGHGTVKGHETGMETCYDMGCRLSYQTDCHRCNWDSQQTMCIYC